MSFLTFVVLTFVGVPKKAILYLYTTVVLVLQYLAICGPSIAFTYVDLNFVWEKNTHTTNISPPPGLTLTFVHNNDWSLDWLIAVVEGGFKSRPLERTKC